MSGINEKFLKSGLFKVQKYWADAFIKANTKTGKILTDKPYESIEWLNAYVNLGGALALSLLIGGAGTPYNNANSYTGVGDSSTATTAVMTDLQASTNKLRKAMDATFPSISGQVCTFKSTYASGDANYAWNEAAIFNHVSAGTMLCRGVSSMGTKTSAGVWVLSYTLTLP